MENFLKFIDKSPSCFHAVANMAIMLEEKGYKKLDERAEWKISLGGKYYVTRNDSSIISFQIPSKIIKGFHAIASHSDAPCFKLKEKPEIVVEDQYIKLNTEKYGGMILSTWLDRPLSVAGRVVVCKDEKLVTQLVCIEKDLLVIPNVAIHMSSNKGKEAELNPQVDMLPLLGGIETKGQLMKMISETVGVLEEEILGHDLFVFNREKARVIGGNNDYIMAPRIDDLQCAYGSLQGFLEANISNQEEGYIGVHVVFDNEEVGSMTKQGASSTFLKDTLENISEGLNLQEREYRRMIANSFMISADNAHGVHPNHPEKSDPTNRPYVNGGIVIKYHGSQKYCTDAYSSAYIKKICDEYKIPYQTYANRSDMAGGSTLGNLSNGQVSLNGIDIGLAQFAMHSAYETGGSKDMKYLVELTKLYMEK